MRLSTIDQGRGSEALYANQRPQLLSRLSEDARIESITASNAIEGIELSRPRASAIARGRVSFRNRTEKEFAGYRDALDGLIRSDPEPISEPLILHLHRALLHHVGGGGGSYKRMPNEITSRESGTREVVFRPPPPEETEFLMSELLARYSQARDESAAHPVLLIAALALDLLAIHPFADGNGRTTRLATNSELLYCGYGVVRYASLEQRIFDSKQVYYASLYQSQRQWVETEGGHDIWPWAEYFVNVLADSYSDFAKRVAAAGSMDGVSRQQQVEQWITEDAPEAFSIAEVESALPGVSNSTIRLVLARMRDEGKLSATRGRSAKWRKTDAQ